MKENIVNTVFILDENFNVVYILSNNGDNPRSPFWEDKFIQYLDTGADTYETNTFLNAENERYLVGKNYILFKYKNEYKLFQISETQGTHKEGRPAINLYAETIGLRLKNDIIRPITLECNFKTFLETVLNGTKFKVGYVSPTLENNVQSVVISEATEIYKAIQDKQNLFSAEICFRVGFENNRVTNLYVDAYGEGERGNKTYNRFEYADNVIGITKKEDWSEFATCLIGNGSNGLTFTNIEWFRLMGRPTEKPAGQDWIANDIANKLYNNGEKYITRVYTTDDTDANTLLENTYKELVRVSVPHNDYEVDLALTKEDYENISIGDTNYVIDNDFYPPLRLESRINTLELCFADHTANSCKLSNYRKVNSKLDNKNDIIKDAITLMNSLNLGKLSELDKITIQEYLSRLGLEKSEIDKLFNGTLIDDTEDSDNTGDLPDDDTENYDPVYLSTINAGLWIGDERIYDIKVQGSAQTGESSTGDAKEYAEALAYFKEFNISENAEKGVKKLASNTNKYKLSTIVNYWSGKFGLDPSIVYMMIYAESSGDPYSDAAAYGLMQCEKSEYFNKSQKIKFLDGSTKTFTPSYSTMKPGKETTTLNGITVDKNISNQVMFGCSELRNRAEDYHFNIFATLIGYNMGPGACNWILGKYVHETYGCTWDNNMSISGMKTATKNKIYEVLETYKAPFAQYRSAWQSYWKSQGHSAVGTLKNIEMYLDDYISVNGQLPYFLDKNGNKIGYGVGGTNTVQTKIEPKISGSDKRQIIVDTAIKIVKQHTEEKIATYNQDPRTVNFHKPKRYTKGTGYLKGIYHPICYDCSSLVSCAYLEAGFDSVYNKGCAAGTLVNSACSKDGYKMWKCTKENLDTYALPGDIIMVASGTVKNPGASYYGVVATSTSSKGWNRTHHTMIYCGKVDGTHMVAHARQWAYWPKALMYMPYYSELDTHGIILRPWDLAAADGITETTVVAESEDITDVVLKGLTGANAYDYYNDNMLYEEVTVRDITDKQKYPTSVPYIYIHFGANDLTDKGILGLENLILALRNKYLNIPIFVAKELHVSNKNANYSTINTSIDTFNNEIKLMCNRLDKVYMIDISTGLYNSSNILDENLTDDTGYRFNGQENVNKYYNSVKTTILATPIGYKKKTNDEKDVTKEVNIIMDSNKTYEYGVVQKITFLLHSKVVETFWAKLKFTTNCDSEPTQVTQSKILYLDGTDCVSGALIAKADTTYTITIFASTEDDNISQKYYGTVTGVSGGKSYAKFESFVGKEDVIKIMKTWYDNATKFSYDVPGAGTTTAVTWDNPAAHKDSWIKEGTSVGDAGRYYIDCSSLSKLVYMGWTYEDSPYSKACTKLKRNSEYSWTPAKFPRTAADQAKYCVSHGWVLSGVDTENFTNLEEGDLLFYDRDGKNNDRYMGCSHVALVYGKDDDGDIVLLESVNATPTIRLIKAKENTLTKFLFAARVRKD